MEKASYQKHLGTLLDEKLNSEQHVDKAILKINECVSVIKKLRHNFSQKSLVTRYKTFLRFLIGCGDIIYDQSENQYFREKLQSL